MHAISVVGPCSVRSSAGGAGITGREGAPAEVAQLLCVALLDPGTVRRARARQTSGDVRRGRRRRASFKCSSRGSRDDARNRVDRKSSAESLDSSGRGLAK